MSFDHPQSQSKRDQAYHQLHRLLILQQLPGGSRLRETEWSQRLGVNRSALREAFVRLEAEGLIQLGPKIGYIVPSVTVKDIQDILAVRFALEGTAIDLICQKGLNTPENLGLLTEACDILERLVGDYYHLSSTEADRHFHESLVQASRNPRLAIAYRYAPLPILHPDVLTGPAWRHTEQQTLTEHHAIIDAILKGDAPGAKEILHRHLGHVMERSSATPARNDQ
jgi:DNA-binding GntR family transcriptional regulator